MDIFQLNLQQSRIKIIHMKTGSVEPAGPPRLAGTWPSVFPHQLGPSNHTAGAQCKYIKHSYPENMLIVSLRRIPGPDKPALVPSLLSLSPERQPNRCRCQQRPHCLQEYSQGDSVAWSHWLPRLAPSVLFRRLLLLWCASRQAHQWGNWICSRQI